MITNNDFLKKHIIDEINGGADYVSYNEFQENLSDEDWQNIADQVGKDIMYDPCGSVYTEEGARHIFHKKRHRQPFTLDSKAYIEGLGGTTTVGEILKDFKRNNDIEYRCNAEEIEGFLSNDGGMTSYGNTLYFEYRCDEDDPGAHTCIILGENPLRYDPLFCYETMSEEYSEGDPLLGTQWEHLSLNDYYNMSEGERNDLKRYLEKINAPFGSDIDDEVNIEGNYVTWRDIVSMSSEEFGEFYRDSR